MSFWYGVMLRGEKSCGAALVEGEMQKFGISKQVD